MKNLTLKQLRYFEALARTGHFGRAADDCSVTQPALSMQIKELEAELGSTLVERGRDLRLTGFGEEVAARARDILSAVEELGDIARAAEDRLVGRLRLGVIPTVAPYLLPRVLSALADDQAALDIHVRETVTPRLIAELGEGRLDAAVVALPVSEPSLVEVPLFSEAMLLVRPETQAGHPVPTAEGLREERLLLLEEGHCFRDQALSFCSMPTAMPQEGLDGSSLSTLVQMVGAGLGITLIPEMAVSVETPSAPVVVAHFPAPRPSRTSGMGWRKTTPLSKQLMDIATLVRRAAGYG